MLKCNFLGALVLVGCVSGVQSALAQQVNCDTANKSGTIEGSAKSVGFIAGVKWGTGTLKLNDGRSFKFNFKGVKGLSTGVSAVDFTGDVYNLKNVEDFIGVYYGAGMGMKALISIGPGEMAANNSKCVVIKAKAKGKGVELNAPGPAGFYVQLTQ
jgi:hypothetical protein